jgi:ribulose 1,5-bisphosphate synthetase/thiazole synthase
VKSCNFIQPRMLTQAVAEAHAAVPEGVAVVLGSGMSGLSTAKVLSKHFSTVKVLERDSIRSEWTGETAVDASKVRLLFWSHTHALP